ncbi:MAG: GIY-YIG nuclease family protein [Verrucomicrobia bacterium]|nr:GIY-YIG nuclease family protein [Verrucomicrobiota bacterium]MDA1065789.1 GIY-YIG nuclease family protein [Verrucomicrobiota bacterium]
MPSSESDFFYVYILVCEKDPCRHYTGCTTNLAMRLKKHNIGGVPHTSKYRPWKIETVVRFRNKEKAHAFEAYLKSGSGRQFAHISIKTSV